MKKLLAAQWFCLILYGVCLSIPVQAAQLVTPSANNTQYAAPQETVSYTAVYNVNAPLNYNETGIGLRVHYDSSQLTPANLQVYNQGALPAGEITPDSEDFDSDPETDKYFVLSWLDLDAQWPGSNSLPLDLFTTDFTFSAAFINETTVNLTATATAQDASFQTSAQQYCAKPELSLSTTTPDTTEDATIPAIFHITSTTTQAIECGALTVKLAASGTASAGNDYSALPASVVIPAGQSGVAVPLDVIDDDTVEPDEDVILALLPDNHYQTGASTTATITISSEDQATLLPEVNLAVAKSTVTEGSSGSLLIFANRTGGNLSVPLEVFIELSGSASVNTDYQAFPASITIPASKDKSFAVLILKDDAANENEETLTLSITANEHYQRGANSVVQLSITDDETNEFTNLSIDKAAPATTGNKIPTLNEWMLILMSLLLAIFAVCHSGLSRERKG